MEQLDATANFEPMILQNSQGAFLTIFGLAVTLTFDFLTAKYNQIVSVCNCIYVVRLVKLPQAVCKTSASKLLAYDHGQPDRLKTEC